jgi:hypothetical protein
VSLLEIGQSRANDARIAIWVRFIAKVVVVTLRVVVGTNHCNELVLDDNEKGKELSKARNMLSAVWNNF